MKRRVTVVGGLVVAVAVLGLLLALSDVRELRERFFEVRWAWVGLASLFGVASYVAIGAAYSVLLDALGDRLPRALVVRTAIVATAVTRNVKSAGVAGVAVLAWILSRRGARTRDVITAHVAQLAVVNSFFIAMLSGGVVAVALGSAPAGPDGEAPVAAIGVAAVVLVGLLVLQWYVLLHERALGRWSRGTASLAEWLARRFRREGWGPRTHDFFQRLGGVSRDLLTRDGQTWSVWPWAAVRLATSFVALALCFRAVGVEVTLGVLVVGYAAGKMVGLLAFVPAGLGLIEGSLVGVFHAFGVPYEAALIVALLNRVAYHVVPALVAAILAGPLVREVRQAAEAQLAGEAPVGAPTDEPPADEAPSRAAVASDGEHG